MSEFQNILVFGWIGTLRWSRCSFAIHNEWEPCDRKVGGLNPTYGFYYNLYYNHCDFHNYYCC